MVAYRYAKSNRFFIKVAACISAIFIVFSSVSAVAGGYRLSIDGDRVLLNGHAIKVIGLRCSNALISDRTTRQLVDNLDVFKSYGVNTVSVYFMGSRFGDVKGYRPDSSLDPVYASRMSRIIEAADRRGMIVLVGCMYWSNSRAKEDLDAVWTQSDADKAVANTVRWLSDNGYRNVFVDPDNEGMAHKSKGWSVASMIDAGHAVDPSIPIANNSSGTPPPNADLYIHHSKKVPGRPWIQSEGSAGGSPQGGYWGGYSKKDGYYNYINIGLYTDTMKKNQIEDADNDITQLNGYMLASTWLQCVAPYGPNMRPGGYGSKDDPGIRWWLEHVRDTYGGPWTPPAPLSVGRWNRFETSVMNGGHYADPFRDVSLDVVYTRPDGTQKTFWGFYDGNGRWGIRFMPDQLGTWRYTARFSDGSRGVSGSFDCVESDVPGMISRDETNPTWMGFKGGKHVLVRSFHCGDRLFADTDNSVTGEKWSPEMRQAFLDWAEKQGYNMLSVASHYLNRDVDGRGRGWDTPDLWDGQSRRPQPVEFRRMESVMDSLSDRGMIVYPFAGFFGQSSDFPTDHADQDLYVKYVLARLGPYWNAVLNVAGPEPLLKNKKFQNAMSKDDIDRLGKLISNRDVFGHLLTIHNPGSKTFTFMDSKWLSLVTVQGFKTRDWQQIYTGLIEGNTGKKPVYSQEVFWPGNTHGHGEFTDDEIRKKAYTLIMAATTINFGDMHGDSSSGFSGSLNLADRVQSRHDIVKRVWDFFETIPFYRLNPRQDLVSNGFCLAETGRTYLVYLPDGGDVTLSTEGTGYKAVWINAKDTTDRRSASGARNAGTFRAPADGDDWLLYLTSSDS